jgi:zinc protease
MNIEFSELALYLHSSSGSPVCRSSSRKLTIIGWWQRLYIISVGNLEILAQNRFTNKLTHYCTEVTFVAQQAPEIRFEKYRLTNGLQVIFHIDRKLPVTHVNIWYHVGSKNEKPGRTGFAHLFEHMMFQGSKHADGEYLTYAEAAGANLREGGVNGTTSFDRTNYFETVPSESLEYALWLESDRMGFLTDALTQEKLDKQRSVVKNERRQSYENVPYGRALQMIFENLFPKGHPYSWLVIGSQEDLDAASLDDVKGFFHTFYTPNNCSLVISGDYDEREARRLVEQYFGPFAPGPALERTQLWVPRLDGEKRIEVFDRVPQERIYLIWPSVPYFHSGDAELDLASRILSQGKNSRLYKALVYDRQIASDVSAFNYSLEMSGVFGVVATVRPGHATDEVVRVIDDEFARFAETGPTDDELLREKAKQEFDFVSGLERIGGFGGKADLLNQYNTFLGEPGYFQEDYDRYQVLSAAGIRDAVQRHLSSKGRLSVTFLPETSERSDVPDLDRSHAPQFGSKRAFHPPLFSSRQLDNGLTVIVTERPELPKVAVSLMVKSGSAADPASRPGTAWMTTEMLDEGTTSRSALEIQAELDRMGTALYTAAETEVSHISLETLKRNLMPSLDLLADLAMSPVFPPDELERQRKRRLDGILQERHNPPVIARRVFRIALFGGHHPYGRDLAGSEASITSLRREDLEEYYQAYWKPNNSAIVYAGDITMDEAIHCTRKVLDGWSIGTVPEGSIPVIPPPEKVRIYLVDRQDAVQSQIRIGSIGPKRANPDYHAIELMNAILGGAFTSRLNLNLREDKGYTYGAYSNFSYGRDLGLWSCGAGVQTQFSKESVSEFLKELTEISQAKPLTHKELETAKANITRGFAQRFETLGRLVDQVADTVSHDLPLSEITSYEKAIEEVTLEQTQAVARKYINPSRIIAVLVGDIKKIEPRILELGAGTVEVVDVDAKPVRKAIQESE